MVDNNHAGILIFMVVLLMNEKIAWDKRSGLFKKPTNPTLYLLIKTKTISAAMHVWDKIS